MQIRSTYPKNLNNGNLTADPYQGKTHISYDVLNKTDTTVITSGSTYITYTYDEGGNLLREKAYNSGVLTQTDYIDGFVYTGTGTQTLSYAPMPEGRLLTTSLIQEYVITDPQGNARVSLQNNSGVAKVTEENSYYGFGLLMPGSLVGFSSPPIKNMYNGGSEWQNDTKSVNAGVPDYYQTFYRNYYPTLGRFIGVDPMAEGSESMGVYHYAGDNPVIGNDPGGDKSCVGCNMGGGGIVSNSEFDQEIQQEVAQWELADEAADFAMCGCGVLEGQPGYFSWNSSSASGTAGSSTQASGSQANGASANQASGGSSATQTNPDGSNGNGNSGNSSTSTDGSASLPNAPSGGPLLPIVGQMLKDVNIFGTSTGASLLATLREFTLAFGIGSGINTHGQPVNFALIGVGFRDPGYGYQSFKWIQTIRKISGNQRGSPYVDMTVASQKSGNFPFYYSPQELLDEGTSIDYTSLFSDQPIMLLGSTSWIGELSLVGQNGNQLTILATFIYGFTSDGVINTPITPYRITSPSMYQQNVINEYNFSH